MCYNKFMDNIKYIDAHAHLFDLNCNLNTLNLNNVSKLIIASYKEDNLITTLKLCETNKNYFACLGIHPQYFSDYNEKTQNFIKQNKNKIVGIGEIGLDDRFDNFSLQVDTFEKQLQLAQELNFPIVVHLVGSYSFNKFFEIIKNYNVQGMIHCFSSSLENAKKILDMGFYLSFAGNLTYKKNVNLQKVATFVPLSNILLETDSPSMSPSGFGRAKNNTPNNIVFVAQTLAQLKNLPLQEIAFTTNKNATKLFNLDK